MPILDVVCGVEHLPDNNTKFRSGPCDEVASGVLVELGATSRTIIEVL
jgi:hypothetical protein